MLKSSLGNNYRLGLNIKTNSIGWGILDLNKDGKPWKILGAGVRPFPDGRNPKDQMPLAIIRTKLRTIRKRRKRFLARKLKLLNCLIRVGLMPSDEVIRHKLKLLNPYELRAKAVSEALNSDELGEVIFHLNQRRGFKSNRKEQIDEKELTATKENQELLAQKIAETGAKTLGVFLYKERMLKGLPVRAKPGELGLYPTRIMYKNEFDEIKKSQFSHQKLTKQDWQEIEEIIFYQRPLKPQTRGVCQFINKFNDLPKWASDVLDEYKNLSKENNNAKGLPRANLALPSYMKFRILSEINNLKIIQDEQREILLDAPQKRKIIEYLNHTKTVNFSSLRKRVGFGSAEYRFNFEEDKKNKLAGNETEILLKSKLGEKWSSLSLIEQDEIVEFLINANNEEQLYDKALKDWNFDITTAEKLKEINPNQFKKGIGNLCKELLQELVIEIEEKNCSYNTAMKNLGFDLRQKKNQKIQTQLDYYGKVVPVTTKPVKSGSKKEVEHGKIANPTVHIALNQLRELINSIIKRKGNPTEIHIEIERSLNISHEEKRQLIKQQQENKKENELIAKELEELGQNNSFDNRLKIKLWKELNLKNCNDRKCPFCGIQIGIAKIFSYDIQIAHILPFSKTYDQSRANKILAHKACAYKKGNCAPFEIFGDSTFNFISNLPKNKQWRFREGAMEKFEDENNFRATQLNDKRYLSKVAIQYLAQICPENKIKSINGRLTALLRHHWGLNSILNLHLQRNSEEQKNKQIYDRRYNAVDAIIIGITDANLLQQISLDNLNNNSDKIIINPPKGWDKFRDKVTDAAKEIIISYRKDHDPNSELHSQTFYGVLNKPISEQDFYGILNNQDKKKAPDKAPFNVVFSKKLSSLSKNEISQIRDKKIREELEELTKDITKGRENKKKLGIILQDFSKAKGIKNIRLLDKIRTIIKDKYNNGINADAKSHISLWKMPDGKLITDPVSNLRAIKNDKEKLKPHPAAKLLMRLWKGDMVRLTQDGKTITAKITSIREDTLCWYILHNFSSDNKEAIGSFVFNKNTLVKKNLRKIFVSPMGKVRDPKSIKCDG